MTEPSSAIGEVAKTVRVFTEKISSAITGLARPWQEKRVARGEVEAEIIRAAGRIDVSDLERRAVNRWLNEETKRQENMEKIAEKAVPMLGPGAQPDKLDDDWIANFFDRSRLISDEQIQEVWAKVLAGEANAPGTFSKRTINLLASLDSHDATIFYHLCSFLVASENELIPLVYNVEASVYQTEGSHSVLSNIWIASVS